MSLAEIFDATILTYLNEFSKLTYFDKSGKQRDKKNIEFSSFHMFDDKGVLFNNINEYLSNKLKAKWLYTGYALSYNGMIPKTDADRFILNMKQNEPDQVIDSEILFPKVKELSITSKYLIPFKKNLTNIGFVNYIKHQLTERLPYINMITIEFRNNNQWINDKKYDISILDMLIKKLSKDGVFIVLLHESLKSLDEYMSRKNLDQNSESSLNISNEIELKLKSYFKDIKTFKINDYILLLGTF